MRSKIKLKRFEKEPFVYSSKTPNKRNPENVQKT